ncbi:alanine racemase [Pseudoxanthomonas dokdonensis]|uniref:Alanine racemase n=1 Tax=Pseudoxanthomonas dokdonensis TaxID=344882 RepID=A0A0R0CQ70_9GAMM|nr:alanine racemase [Pseudoxanthomonas dokdonensis]KRG72015.1 alanine racemase [Pseudoxanthomonas dokdonensis]
MRPARALIDLSALRHNYRLARRLGGGKALAVVKADAYGHGAVRCAQALQGEADGFAVACIEEALALREAGISAPILLLEGFFEASELPLLIQHELWCVLHSQWQIDALEAAATSAYMSGKRLKVWLKMDTGMHRLGLSPGEYATVWQRLAAMAHVQLMVAMSHFARADEPDCPRTAEQAASFVDSVQLLAGAAGPALSLSNSPALLAWPQLRNDWARPGLMLYGASPLAGDDVRASQLQPVMTLESRVIAVRTLDAGEPIGYGGRFVTDQPTRVGVVAMGYADGYPQFAPNGTPVSIDGRNGCVIGRVSMDMLTVDLSDHPQAGVGSVVRLWGEGAPTAAQLAAQCGTSAYQLLCGLKRVPRVYLGG